MEFVTLYCNKPHRLSDGQPIEHKCRVLPPEILEAERDRDIDKVIAFYENPQSPLILSNGVAAEENDQCR